jgi:hypothetical protein
MSIFPFMLDEMCFNSDGEWMLCSAKCLVLEYTKNSLVRSEMAGILIGSHNIGTFHNKRWGSWSLAGNVGPLTLQVSF